MKIMKRLLLLSSLLGLALGAAAQTSPAAQATLASDNTQPTVPAVTSNGPVTLDYKALPAPSSDSVEANLSRKVRGQLLRLPYYSMFDDLEYSVQGRTVTLSGAVTSIHSQTRQDAERAVKHIEGVDKVVNNIQVLPPSPFDEQARVRIYRALARTGGLSQYFWPASPDIRIVVANQRVTLKGYVNNEGDKNMATVAANQVRDVFQVTNDLQVVR
jgi:hyperosmotically inducible periplasmic protein